LTTNTLPSASQEPGAQLVNAQSLAFVQELLRPFVNEMGQVREELGTERARRQMAEERIAALEQELEELRASREVPEPETVEEAPESPESRPGTPAPTEDRGRAQGATGAPEEEPRRGFFSRLFGG
jgi:hypothetical protein